ncbi:MAG: YdaU family protein [Candidatus Thiodiazotropha sp. (ex Lucina pensylvanica)]|nr:YdaU family protein [Candidatus Thiodiazotropha sp. (ex Lucina pensylvanica)]
MSRVNVWWPMYPANFTMDTACLTNEQVGIYVKLLNAAWHNNGAISSDPKQLARVAGVSPQKWKKISESIRPLFTEKEGKWLSDWLSEELAKAKANRSAKRNNALKRWHGQSETGMQMHSASNAKAFVGPMQKQCPIPIPVPIPDTSRIEAQGSDKKDAEFGEKNHDIGTLGGVA